jgi:hypothetical protein
MSTQTETATKTNGSKPAAPAAKPPVSAAAAPAKKGRITKEEKEAQLAKMSPEERAQAEADAERKARKIFIVTGTVREFKNAREAEKFLNGDQSAPSDYTVIKGTKTEKKQKISLR